MDIFVKWMIGFVFLVFVLKRFDCIMEIKMGNINDVVLDIFRILEFGLGV